MANQYIEKIIQRISENTNTTTNPGIIIASPSESPPYKYHWIRDSALVMRTFVDMYETTKEPIYFQYIINYIENESKLQNLEDTKSGLGEPKYEINCKPFQGEWGRPQNDGPALRGIVLYKIIRSFKYKYDTLISTLILPIILKDLHYILQVYNQTSFDIWEELNGWHFYTRLVQLKFIKDSIHNYHLIKHSDISLEILHQTYSRLSSGLKDHLTENSIISSFDKDGTITKGPDASILLAFSHISYDDNILQEIPFQFVNRTCTDLVNHFRKKYKDDDLHLIGRYPNDKYYDGHIWVLCSCCLGQIYIELYRRNNIINYSSPMHRSKSNPSNNYIEIANQILERILTLDTNLILPEQFNANTNEYLSAKKLTWNYSELYKLYKGLN